MGQKTNPNGIRLGINKDWKSKYYPSSNKLWSEWVSNDRNVRNHFSKFSKKWSISSIDIERSDTEYRLIIHTSRPGTIIGEEGKNIKNIEKEVSKILKDRSLKIHVDVVDIQNPDLDATIIANDIAIALENRAPFRIAQKKAIKRVMRAGAKGIKTQVSGRLNGVDMARTEGYSEGEVPLQTLRNDIDYAVTEALTTYGILGVKVWISKGEIINGKHVDLKINQKDKPYNKNRPNNKRFNKSKIEGAK